VAALISSRIIFSIFLWKGSMASAPNADSAPSLG
jgi:hypothetical protein